MHIVKPQTYYTSCRIFLPIWGLSGFLFISLKVFIGYLNYRCYIVSFFISHATNIIINPFYCCFNMTAKFLIFPKT